jgi:hypothetical protein
MKPNEVVSSPQPSAHTLQSYKTRNLCKGYLINELTKLPVVKSPAFWQLLILQCPESSDNFNFYLE